MRLKNLSFNSLVFFLAVIMLASCSRDQIAPDSADLETLKQELFADQDFIAYTTNHNNFFEDLRTNKYNIFDIRNQIGDFQGVDYQSLKENTSNEAVLYFADFMVNNQRLLKSISQRHPEFQKLNAEEFRSLLTVDTSVDNRGVDCLDQFQVDWQVGDDFLSSGYDLAADAFYNHAVDSYDACCDDGGDGCP